MAEEILSKLRAAVRDVPNFPKPGIVFKDITPILKDAALFRASIEVYPRRLPAVMFKFGASLHYLLMLEKIIDFSLGRARSAFQLISGRKRRGKNNYFGGR